MKTDMRSSSGAMELLSPAGSPETALAALEAGADAVYAGLQSFNARNRGENFTAERMGSLIAFAHERGKKVYVTFNTLLKESEIPAAAEALAELDYLHPDALIVQDIGVVRMIRNYFPDLRIHASTQMAIHDSHGVEIARQMGIRRVILERQMTLEEIRLLAERSPLELEVFVHGALCCCLSGCCLFSSWIGGASGNRGLCKQPCRRVFHDRNGEHFAFSTRDLAAFSLIPEFRKMGIASLKIEGRLRNAEYVSAVTKAYRLLLDSAEETWTDAMQEAQEILLSSCARENSLGFYTKESAGHLVRPDVPGAVGQFCGQVRKGTGRDVECIPSRRIHVGDTFRIQNESGDEAKAFTLLTLQQNGRKTLKASAGQICTITLPNTLSAPEKGFLYRIGMAGKHSAPPQADQLPPFRPAADFSIRLTKNGLQGEWEGRKWEYPVSFSEAKKHAYTASQLRDFFRNTGEASFSAGKTECTVEGALFVPESVLKTVRRAFREWLGSLIRPDDLRRRSDEKKQRLLTEYRNAAPECRTSGTTVLTQDDEKEILLPFFTPENELGELEKILLRERAAGKRILRVSSLSHFFWKRKFPDLILKTVFPLPLANSFAAAEARALGADSVLIHIELDKREMEAMLRKSPVPLEILRAGRPVLLATRAEITLQEHFSDSRNEAFLLKHRNGLHIVYPETVLKFPALPGTAELFDFRECTPEEAAGDGVSFNFDRIWKP